MKSKRLLTLLLALCMVITLATPAFAVLAGSDAYVVPGADSEQVIRPDTSASSNGLLASGNGTGSNGLLNLRDNPITVSEVLKNYYQGIWEISPGSAPELSLLQAEAPACLKDLMEAEVDYAPDEMVRAFIVLEDAPLAEKYNSINTVSASAEKKLTDKQEKLIENIEKYVLGGQKLNIRYQFTYLTNSITVETAFGNLAKIASFKGVKSVFITPVYAVSETVANPNTVASGSMTGVDTVWEDLGFSGQGMTVAVIDSGLDLDHPAFGPLDSAMVAENDTYLDRDDIAAVLTQLNAYSRRTTITAKTLYRSTKVPYAFNYCDDNLLADHSGDNQGDHGTHVSGIVAANRQEGIPVVGMAPDAQIVVMKVFGVNGGAYADDIAAALEDAMTLGCDVVNASLGSPAGFSDSGYSEIDAIYDRLATQNIIATISAGNEGTSAYDNMWGTNLNRTQNPENGTVGSPALYHNAFIVASAENSEVMTSYFSLSDGTRVFFNGSLEYAYGYVYGMVEILAGETYEYVFIDGMGADIEDFLDEEGNSLVEGKIAVVWRGGGVNFGTKISNAEYAGAVACVIANNNDTDDIFNFYMSTELEKGVYPGIPTCLISMADGLAMAAAEDQTMTVSAAPAPRVCEGGQMSSFSSWGVSSDLRLVPDITGIGGNVFSCYDDGQYGLMSGTSMSSPQLAGISALVMQYLYSKYPDAANDGTIREIALALLMSTADPVISNESNLAASPRQQGAGLVNAAEAVKSLAYLTVNGGRPKAELGDSATGEFTFTFEIHNFGDAAQTYVLSSSLLTEAVVEQYGEYFMAGYETRLSGNVSFDQDRVTVAAGETVTVSVSISLSGLDKTMFAQYWENGGFVEGFVYLENTDAEGVDLNLPFMGFYGDWTEAPMFDSAYWYDNSFWGEGSGWPEGDEFYHAVWTDLGGTSWVLGFNPYTGAVTDGEGNVIYNPANNSISPNGDGVIDGFDDIYISLLRNAKTLTITFSNAVTGEILHTETSINNGKTMYISAYGRVVPWLYSWYGEGVNFSGLENNTKLLMTVEATVDYGDGGEHMIQIPFTIDTEVPKLQSVYQYEEDGKHYLTVVASDNINVGGIFLMNRAGTQIYGADYCTRASSNGTYVATFEVDGLGSELMVVLGDYAGNEGYYNITYTEAGSNLPTVPTDQLYAYRIMDDVLNSDHMFGWVSMNFPAEGENAEISVWSDDYLEYAALTAAEYAGGKIFAVDAVYNLVVMDPGLWNRTTICNLGAGVLDMTFDDSTDTMYVLVKDEYYVSLQTLDLMTGELTMVADYGFYYYGPWAITDDDNGTLYALKYNNSGLFTLDTENEYALVPVTDGEGNAVTVTDSNGDAARPQYSQSIAYVDGTIYWAYVGYATSELIAIDLETFAVSGYAYSAWAYTTEGELVKYNPVTELVGLLTLTETEWTIPEGSVLNGLNLDAENLVLTPGKSETLRVSPTPWNYALGEVTWTSSDPDVATVVDGVVTGVSEGMATITATAEGMEAYCDVIVVNTETVFNAYNFYSGDGYNGYMVEVDTGRMDYRLLDESPVDFVAGDYNGHDGCFYGYSDGGQFWRYDLTTGTAVKLGAPVGVNPADMAYDYSTGLLYAVVPDVSTGLTSLCMVNLTTGQMETVYQDYFFAMTLAIDLSGNIYSITNDGYLVQFVNVYDEDFGESYWYAEPLMEGLGELQYLQSMCYDYAHDVILWDYCEASSIYWIDVNGGYVIPLGDPTGTGVFEFVGMYTVPEEIPVLDPVAVEDFYAEDMLMLTGSTKYPNATVWPFNATSQNVAWTSEDESIVRVNADGSLTAVSEGTVTIYGELYDAVADDTYTVEFAVSVVEGADEIYGMLMTDLATYNGQCWLRLYAIDPSITDILGYTDYEIYAEEYYDGKLYAYGYDPMDWSGNWQFFILDAETHTILEQHDLGAAFPFVYDMTYDYTTSTMYALAGPNTNSDLYAVNMRTGELIMVAQTEQFFLSLTASPDGTLYAIERSEEEYDFWTWSYTLGNAQMYTIDPATGDIQWFADTGIQCNKLASMAYDYDTDYIYWTALAETSSFTGGLCLIDPATGEAVKLGTIGAAGSQISGLYILSDNFPEEPELSLMNVVMDTTKTVVNVGGTVSVNAFALPLALDVEVVWTSSDESVATVDENGVITGVAQGAAEITATVTYDGVTMSATCQVGVMNADASFLSWNRTDMGWSAISRADYTVVTNLTEGEEMGVSAIAVADGVVYGYDMNNQLFSLDLGDFSRTAIGESISDFAIEEYLYYSGMTGVYEPSDFRFEVRDMAYDPADELMLFIGTVQMYNAAAGEYSEINGGNSIYAVDLETGEVFVLYTFEDNDYIFGLAADQEGGVYFYSTFNDYIYKLDLYTGLSTQIISLQSQSLYGTSDEGVREAMYFDELTGLIYMTFTSNGRMYRMLSIDPTTGALTILSDIGEKVYDPDSWVYIGDCFTGLVFASHEHSYTAVVTDPTCTEQGYTTHICSCGDFYVDSYTDPTDHSWGDWTVTTAPTCTEAGEETRTCSACGEAEHRAVDPQGHDYEDVVTDPTCTEQGYTTHTCGNCGDSYVDSYTDPTGHSYGDDGVCDACGDTNGSNVPTGDTFNGVLWMSLLVISVLGAVTVVVSKKSWLNK